MPLERDISIFGSGRPDYVARDEAIPAVSDRARMTTVGGRRAGTIIDRAPFGRAHGIRHLAAILDGNRRWAVRRGLPVVEGYRAGGAFVHTFLGWCEEAGIPLVTLWPLSGENLRRQPGELRALIGVIVHVLDELAESRCWRLRLLGDLTALPPEAARAIGTACERTRHVQGVVVNIAVAYSGRQEIIRAIRAIVAKYAVAEALDQLPGMLNEALLAEQLDTAGQPDPDLVIRTSGEQRLSGFMTWQSAYSELYFSRLCWPELSKEEFMQALATYQQRKRRFGL